MIERLSRARAYEAQADAFAVSINAGFASADVAEVGPTVLVTGQGNGAAHTASTFRWHSYRSPVR